MCGGRHDEVRRDSAGIGCRGAREADADAGTSRHIQLKIKEA
jgi:hypothetical protein